MEEASSSLHEAASPSLFPYLVLLIQAQLFKGGNVKEDGGGYKKFITKVRPEVPTLHRAIKIKAINPRLSFLNI